MYTLGIVISKLFGVLIGKLLFQPVKNESEKSITSGPLDIKVGDYFAYIFETRDKEDARIILRNRAIVKLSSVYQYCNNKYTYNYEYKSNIFVRRSKVFNI